MIDAARDLGAIPRPLYRRPDRRASASLSLRLTS
jgi:hypothetical protein